MDMETPNTSLSANAATAEVDFGYTVEGTDIQQHWDARYGLRLGTHELGSSYVYARHDVALRYEWNRAAMW